MPIREMEKVKGKETDPPLAHPFLRATLGINILIHGATRILGGLGALRLCWLRDFTPLPCHNGSLLDLLTHWYLFFLVQFIWPSSPSASRFLP